MRVQLINEQGCISPFPLFSLVAQLSCSGGGGGGGGPRDEAEVLHQLHD